MKRLALTIALLSLASCGTTETDARQFLEKDGLKVVEITKDGDVYTYKAKKGDQICDGTLTLKKAGGASSSSHFSSCQRDTSACQPGQPKECVRIADELYAEEAKVFPTQAAELYRTACADGNGHACTRAGEFEAIDEKWAKVREYSQKGCELGDGDGCVRLGFTELNGEGTEKNRDKALELLKKGCDRGAVRGCRGAAGLLLDGDGDLEAATELARKACKAKHGDSCYVLGVALFRGKTDYAGARTHFEAACSDDELDKKQGDACNFAGVIHLDGLGTDKDVAKALSFFERACQHESGPGCANAGKMYRQGVGATRDADKAKEMFAAACKLGHQESCQ